MRPGSAGAMGSQATEGGDVHVAPGATLWRRKWLLQRQRDHIADIQPLIEIAEQYLLSIGAEV